MNRASTVHAVTAPTVSGMGVVVLDERLGFSTVEAAAAAGLTYREVDNWTRTGAVWPSIGAHGHGTRREWSTVDIERLARIAGVVHRAEQAGLTVTCAAIAAMWDQLAAGDDWTVTLSTDLRRDENGSVVRVRADHAGAAGRRRTGPGSSPGAR